MLPFPKPNSNWNWQHFHIGNILQIIPIYIPVRGAGSDLATSH